MASSDEADIWLLERLNDQEDPRSQAAFERYFPEPTAWRATRERLAAEGYVALSKTGHPRIRALGKQYITTRMYDNQSSPARLPFNVVPGPMASGNYVVKDGLTWDMLSVQGQRKAAGLEMEAAAISRAAHVYRIPDWVVVKGVMDYADPRKDDRYKSFAARASAETLLVFLSDRHEGVRLVIAQPTNRRAVQSHLSASHTRPQKCGRIIFRIATTC